MDYSESAHRKYATPWIKGYNAAKAEFSGTEESIKRLLEENRLAKEEAQREKIKAQTEKLEYNRWQRELARDELIMEKIEQSIHELNSFDVPGKLEVMNTKKSACLMFGDCHYGAVVKIKGLYGEILNEYNPEIFEQRMWQLYYRTLEIIEREGLEELHVYDLGDSIDGLLRVSQLTTLRYGVIDSALRYAEFLSTWLNELSRHVVIKFQMVKDSNHSQLRLCGQPKNAFKEENMSKVIIAFVKERLKENPNFELVQNPTGLIYDIVCSYSILGIHGEEKNMEKALNDFSSIYDVKINYLVGGHIHHRKSEESGFDAEVINIPSIMGVNDYSLSIHKVSNAGAKLVCLETGQGITTEYRIKLQ